MRQSLEPGDVLLVEGNSRISDVIKYLTQSTWSHSTLYVGPIQGANTPDVPSQTADRRLDAERAQPSWRALAASIALTAVLASGSTWFVVGSQPPNTMIADALVSDHIRALMAPEPVDVVSSDRHTVKPWFNGRIPNSPRVVDLAKQNFPLVGGRIDVVGQTPVPTLVYRHAKHVMSVTAMPGRTVPWVSGQPTTRRLRRAAFAEPLTIP